MANFASGHDLFYPTPGSTGQLTVTSATGASTTVFNTQTRAIRVVAQGTAVNSNSWLYMKLGTALEAPQATSTTDIPIPINWPEYFKVYPGQRASFISGDATTSYRVSVTEVSD
jgi:hypothetical protein